MDDRAVNILVIVMVVWFAGIATILAFSGAPMQWGRPGMSSGVPISRRGKWMFVATAWAAAAWLISALTGFGHPGVQFVLVAVLFAGTFAVALIDHRRHRRVKADAADDGDP